MRVPPVTNAGAPLLSVGLHCCATWSLDRRYDQDPAREGGSVSAECATLSFVGTGLSTGNELADELHDPLLAELEWDIDHPVRRADGCGRGRDPERRR